MAAAHVSFLISNASFDERHGLTQTSHRYVLEDCELALILESIHIFMNMTTDSRLINEFFHVGGMVTVMEVLNLSTANEDAKIWALKIMIAFAKAGLKYKEVLCECKTLDNLKDCLHTAKTAPLYEYIFEAFYHIGVDNPKYLAEVYKSMMAVVTSHVMAAKAQQMAGQTIRRLIHQVDNVHNNVVELMIGLLKSPHETTQVEGNDYLLSTNHPWRFHGILMVYT